MAIDYYTIEKDSHSEVVEKKSRFLGDLVHVESLEEAEAFIASVRKKHYDARHHCFAFVVGEPGTPSEIVRSSDDGEPQGTAGKPMLEILTGRDLHNTLIVVTRYFGGTLLGTGGLVRAYSAAAKEAVENAEIVKVCQGQMLTVSCSYTAYGKLQYLFANEGIAIADTRYTDGVEIDIVVPAARVEAIRKMITEATGGAAPITEGELVQYHAKP